VSKRSRSNPNILNDLKTLYIHSYMLLRLISEFDLIKRRLHYPKKLKLRVQTTNTT
jgi:hypothetical protein